jgi:hypothetical protein
VFEPLRLLMFTVTTYNIQIFTFTFHVFRGLGLTNKTMTPGEKGELGEKFVERLLKDPFLTVKNIAKGQTKNADLIVSFNKENNAKVRISKNAKEWGILPSPYGD